MGNPVNLMGFRTTQETNLCIGLGGCFQGASQGKTHSDCGRRHLNREEVASGTPAFIRLLNADIRCNVTRHLKLLPPRFPHHSALLSLLTLSQNKPFLLQVAFSTILPWQQEKVAPAPPAFWVPQYLYLLTILPLSPKLSTSSYRSPCSSHGTWWCLPSQRWNFASFLLSKSGRSSSCVSLACLHPSESCRRERESKKIKLALGMEIYASNTSTRDLRKESLKFKVALNYLSRPCLRDGGGDSGGRSDDNTIARQQQGWNTNKGLHTWDEPKQKSLEKSRDQPTAGTSLQQGQVLFLLHSFLSSRKTGVQRERQELWSRMAKLGGNSHNGQPRVQFPSHLQSLSHSLSTPRTPSPWYGSIMCALGCFNVYKKEREIRCHLFLCAFLIQSTTQWIINLGKMRQKLAYGCEL